LPRLSFEAAASVSGLFFLKLGGPLLHNLLLQGDTASKHRRALTYRSPISRAEILNGPTTLQEAMIRTTCPDAALRSCLPCRVEGQLGRQLLEQCDQRAKAWTL